MALAPEPRRRRDVKTQDREKSMSPLDKDQLKRRCLERVRSERSRLMERMRGRSSPGSARRLYTGDTGDAGTAHSPLAAGSGAQRETSSPICLSSAREILRKGLSELSASNTTSGGRRLVKRRYEHPVSSQKHAPLPGTPGDHIVEPAPPPLDDNCSESYAQALHGQHCHEPPSPFLSAIEEENANYRDVCSGGRGRSLPQQPRSMGGGGGSRIMAPGDAALVHEERGGCESGMMGSCGEEEMERQLQNGLKQHQPEAMVEGDDLGWGDGGGTDDDYCDEERMLSPEEYLEMMQYIEEACREEDLRAEAEALEDYEMTKRLEEEEVEYAVSSALADEEDQTEAVLCPLCKRNYLVQAGPPSAAIICACGFRLPAGGDQLSLEHLRQQLAETYSQHSAGCSAEPVFAVDGESGFEILWSSCDVCGLSRVVM